MPPWSKDFLLLSYLFATCWLITCQDHPSNPYIRTKKLKEALLWEINTGAFIHTRHTPLKIRRHCKQLFTSKNENPAWPPPKMMPEELRLNFTLHNAIPVFDWYIAEKQNGGNGYHWPKSLIQQYITERLSDNLITQTCYNQPECWQAVLSHPVSGKRGIVFGSQTPWAESLLLAANASEILTYEYMKIKSDDSRITTVTPSEVAVDFLRGTFLNYDFGFTYSSFEHDGLGRYGDPLNPFGDIESVNKASCLIKPGGYLFLGIPVGPDALVWNAHRIYGRLRIPLLVAGWDIIDIVGDYDLNGQAYERHIHQPIFILRNRRPT